MQKKKSATISPRQVMVKVTVEMFMDEFRECLRCMPQDDLSKILGIIEKSYPQGYARLIKFAPLWRAVGKE